MDNFLRSSYYTPFLLSRFCFVTIHLMESFDTNPDAATAHATNRQTFTIEGIEALKPGTCARIALHNGDELAIYNVNGEYYATDNSCPHRGAPLSEGTICGHIVECSLHGWQFDVRTGECLTVSERIRTYSVTKEEGQVRIVIE